MLLEHSPYGWPTSVFIGLLTMAAACATGVRDEDQADSGLAAGNAGAANTAGASGYPTDAGSTDTGGTPNAGGHGGTGGSGGEAGAGAGGTGGSAGNGGTAGSDGGSAGTSGGGTGGGSGGGSPGDCYPVVNEVLTGTSSDKGYEWVEIFNQCDSEINLDGWQLRYLASSGIAPGSIYRFTASNILEPKGYLLIASSSYKGEKDGDLTNGLAADGGGIALTTGEGSVVDSVGWGDAENSYVETDPAPKADEVSTPGESISRLPNGQDTDTNSLDFVQTKPPTPRAENL